MRAYEGKDPYIFVSYAHTDSAIVVPIIDVLQSAGFRVWYDQGIEAGTEWPAYIEEHLDNCDRFLVFMSPSTVTSVNCRNEINYASTLKKEILVVYLEETVLKYGLNLQLNSKQSLFRYRHTSEESFLEELKRAKILSSCLAGASETFVNDAEQEPMTAEKSSSLKEDKSKSATVFSHLRGEYAIARVGTVGAKNANDPWEKGEYTQNIDISRFSVVNFHCNLLKTVETAGERTVSVRVYDERSALVFENDARIFFNVGDNKFSTGWIIKEPSGFCQMTGNYTALIFLDDSRVYEYPFTIVDKKKSDEKSAGERKALEQKLAYPRLLFLHAFAWLMYILLLTFATASMPEPAWIFGIIAVIFTIYYAKETRKRLGHNWLVTFFLIVPFSLYYGLFLLVMAIFTMMNRKKWQARLKELQE